MGKGWNRQQKSFFLSVVLVLSAAIVSNSMAPGATGLFYTYELNVDREPGSVDHRFGVDSGAGFYGGDRAPVRTNPSSISRDVVNFGSRDEVYATEAIPCGKRASVFATSCDKDRACPDGMVCDFAGSERNCFCVEK
tara:strand:+ start:32625 stop:33035 length:411 start_codon:yes stop_codon:yes gene_type:complete